MATVEFLEKRIAGKQAELNKLNAKLARIEKAEASNWEVNPYYYTASDKKWTIHDIEEAKEALAKYEDDLRIANEKAGSRNVKAIIEFLNMWQEKCFEYYDEMFRAYYEDKAEIDRAGDTEKKNELRKALYREVNGETERRRVEKKSWGGDKWWVTEYVKVYTGKYEEAKPYIGCKTLAEAREQLKKDLKHEAEVKYDYIIERTNEIVGKITDASFLEVGLNGELNGVIAGEKGKASVKTIGAGGYNIQCYHFRTLIRKVRG